MKKIILAIWLVLVVNNLYAQIGARGIGMGGAFVGVGGDVSNLYWNPAGLGLLKECAIGYMTGPAHRKDTFTTSSFIEEPKDDYYFYILPNRVLASVLKLKEDSLPEGVIGYVYASDVFRYIGTYTRDYINSHQLSIGLKLSEGFYWGINIKGCSMKRKFEAYVGIRDIQKPWEIIGISYVPYVYSKFYTDMDIGFLLKREYISFGAVLAHINQPSIYMPEVIEMIQVSQAVPGQATETVTLIIPEKIVEKKLPRIFKAGIAITPDDKTVFSLDIYDISGNTKKEEDLSQDLSFGIERKITDNLAVRTGLWHINSKSKDNRGISYSLSYNFKLFNNNIVDISYGYVKTKKERHSLDVSMRF